MILLFARHALPQPQPRNDLVVIPGKLNNQKLVQKFYQKKGQALFWFQCNESVALRNRLRAMLDSAEYMALEKENYHYSWIKDNLNFYSADSQVMRAADYLYTDAVISYCKDIFQGSGIEEWLDYDEISPKYEAADNSYIVMGLSAVTCENELQWFVNFLERNDREYLSLKQELRRRIDSADQAEVRKLSQSINQLRWMKHFGFRNYIVVNAASAVVRYYACDTVQLRMKAVVGTPATPTPRFAGYCTDVVFYPYWHVPYSIAVNEIIPQVKRNPAYLESRNLQLIDGAGTVLDPGTINWSAISTANFPYRFRQSTGCDNALGVIKFNLTDPFSVYMHDTNNKTAFLAGARYFSHGCIRLESPVELAMALLPGQVDEDFLEACRKDQKPGSLKLLEPVPVFVVYMTSEYDQDSKVKYYKDVYRLIR